MKDFKRLSCEMPAFILNSRGNTKNLLNGLKVENFACTNFRENKISRRLIFAIELFIFLAVTNFPEFRDHYHVLI